MGRGFVDVRGLVHAHSIYSHDACDNAPVDENGVRDAACLADFRRDLCTSQHDFVFLTDHNDAFNTTEFPETLLFRPDEGDVLDDDGTANVITCADGHRVTIVAGTEQDLMSVGIERHLDDRTLYTQQTDAAVAALHDAGAVVLLAHPEDYDVDALAALPIDGFEMFNLHANTVRGAAFALDMTLRANDGDPGLPHPDLFLLALWSEDPAYLERWGRVLARGKRVVSTMGTDCHRNTFRTLLEDGERADSYRRMMIAFSNHLRVVPGADGVVDDADLKDALASGRLWGAFEVMGYPAGFDAFAERDGDVFEIGSDVPVGARIQATMPRVVDLDPAREAPALRMRLLKAVDVDAGFEVVADVDGDLDVVVDEAGVYRVEVRMLPLHLRADLRDEDRRLLEEIGRDERGNVVGETDYVWIYANPFYVGADLGG